MNRWVRRLSLLAAVVAAVIFGAGTQAHAAPPQNVGWLYTQGRSGAGFFDADLAGYPSVEKITTCDNKTDGRGVITRVEGYDRYEQWLSVTVRDPSNDGNCAAQWDNYFADGYTVYVQVCEYWGTREDNCARANGVA